MTIDFRPGQFYGALERSASGGVFDIAAMAASGSEDDVETHTHADAHFVLVLSGIYLSTARGAPAAARAPFLVFNPPGVTHRDRFVGGVGSFLTVSLDAATLREVAARQSVSEAAIPLAGPSPVAGAFRIAREVRACGRDAAVMEASAWELVAATGAAADRSQHAPPWAFAAYEAVMDGALDARLSVGEVAARIGVHPVHLARVFRRAWGCTPGDLMRWRRAERASRLLLGPLPAAEVAAAVGFVDQSHMNRAFRSLFGMTPGAWRRAHDVAPMQDQAATTA